MKIAVFSPYLFAWGGGERYVGTLAAALSERHQVDLLHVGLIPGGEFERRLGFDLGDTRLRRLQARPVLMPRSLRERLLYGQTMREMHAEVRRVSAGYDLFIGLDHDIPVLPRSRRKVLLVQRPVPRPLMADARLGLVPRLEGVRRLLWYRRRLEAHDLLVYNSEFTRSATESHWHPGTPGVVVHPPVEMASSAPSGAKEALILSVGRFFLGAHNKKRSMMIEAFRRLMQGGLTARLCLVGGAVDAPEVKAYVAGLRAEAAGLPVEVHENLPCDELLKLYRRAAVYWHAAGFGENERASPDRMEHFGISTVEAMAHGCVPVVIARGGQPEIVEHGVDGLLWETREALVDGTRRVLRDIVLARRLGAAAALKACRFSRAQFEARVHGFVSRLGRSAAEEAAA